MGLPVGGFASGSRRWSDDRDLLCLDESLKSLVEEPVLEDEDGGED